MIHARFGHPGEIHAERRFPQHAEIVTVAGNFRKIIHRPQIEPEFAPGGQPVGRNFDFFFIRGRAGEVAYSGSGMVAPGNQLVQSNGGRRAPVWRKIHLPRTGDFRRRGQVARSRVQNRSTGRAQSHLAVAPQFNHGGPGASHTRLPFRCQAEGGLRRQGERFIFGNRGMMRLIIERVFHAQFLDVHVRRVAAKGTVAGIRHQLAATGHFDELRGDIHLTGPINGSVNGVLDFQFRPVRITAGQTVVAIRSDKVIRAGSRVTENDEHGAGGIKIHPHSRKSASLMPDGRGFNQAGVRMPELGDFSGDAKGAIRRIKLSPLVGDKINVGRTRSAVRIRQPGMTVHTFAGKIRAEILGRQDVRQRLPPNDPPLPAGTLQNGGAVAGTPQIVRQLLHLGVTIGITRETRRMLGPGANNGRPVACQFQNTRQDGRGHIGIFRGQDQGGITRATVQREATVLHGRMMQQHIGIHRIVVVTGRHRGVVAAHFHGCAFAGKISGVGYGPTLLKQKFTARNVINPGFPLCPPRFRAFKVKTVLAHRHARPTVRPWLHGVTMEVITVQALAKHQITERFEGVRIFEPPARARSRGGGK